jgi:hypothetical protein
VTAHITITCACGAYLSQHNCPLSWPEEVRPPEVRFTLDEVYTALSEALGGDLPDWVWYDVRGRLKGTQP